jgi:hypothetical protein
MYRKWKYAVATYPRIQSVAVLVEVSTKESSKLDAGCDAEKVNFWCVKARKRRRVQPESIKPKSIVEEKSLPNQRYHRRPVQY